MGETEKICNGLEVGINSMFDIIDVSTSKSSADYIFPSIVVVCSVCFLCVGARILRPTVVVSAAVGVFFAAYAIFMQLTMVSCAVSLGSSAVLSLYTAIISSCVLKVGLFLLGSAAVAGSLHLTFVAIPVLDTLTPSLGPRSIAYYAVLVIGGLAGGVLIRFPTAATLEVVTSVIGGVGIGYAAHSVVTLSWGNNIPHLIYLAVAVLFTAAGIFHQRRRRRRVLTQPTPPSAV